MLIPKCCKNCSGRKNGVCNCTLPAYCQEYVEDEEVINPIIYTTTSEPKQWWGTDGTDGTGQSTHRMMTMQDLGNWVKCPDCEDFKKQIKVLERALWNTITFGHSKRYFKKRYGKAIAQAEKELEEEE